MSETKRDQRRIPAFMATLLGGYYLPGLVIAVALILLVFFLMPGAENPPL